MYNRYQGNTGHFVRVPDAEPPVRTPMTPHYRRPMPASAVRIPPQQQTRRPPPAPAKKPPPSGGGGILSGLFSSLGGLTSGLSDGLSGILPKVLPDGLELEDLLLLVVLYLMYKESGDKEMLIILGAMFLL